MEKKTFKLADGVWHRVIKIVQEGILLGVDVSDLMRQVSVEEDSENPGSLVLTEAYEKQVDDMHNKLLDQAKDMQSSLDAASKDDRFISFGTGQGKDDSSGDS